jgi:hypothetical protein
MVPGSFRVQSEVVRAGRGAGEIGALGRSSRGSQRRRCRTERGELMEAWWLFAHIQRGYRYSFSFICRLTFLSFRRGWLWRSGNKYVNGGCAGHRIRCSRYGIRMGNCRLRGRMMMGNQFSLFHQAGDARALARFSLRDAILAWPARVDWRLAEFGGYPRLPRAYGLLGGAGIRRVGWFISRLGCIAMRCGSR